MNIFGKQFHVLKLCFHMFNTSFTICTTLVVGSDDVASSYMFRPVDRDVFVCDLNRQLGTPSHWLPVNSCKKEDKEAP